MDLKKFVYNVSRMRWHQRQYFKTRDHYDLLDAKRWEQIVDNDLLQVTQELELQEL